MIKFKTDKLPTWTNDDIDGLAQERNNSSALAMELRLSCTDPLIWYKFPW